MILREICVRLIFILIQPQRVPINIKPNIGAWRNIVLSLLFGIVNGLARAFIASAIACNNPAYPIILGPVRR